MNDNELVGEREMFPYMDESISCMVLRVFIMQGILARAFTSESLWFSSFSCCLIFFFFASIVL